MKESARLPALALALAALAVGAAAAPHPKEPRHAEYAVRWNPAQGGLKTAADVLAFLGGPGTGGQGAQVQFYDLPAPEGAPRETTVILRRRDGEGGESEIRLKYRSPRPLTVAWACPAGIGFEPSTQVDVGFGTAPTPSRVYSYSCRLRAAQPPALLGATARPCASRMVRYETGPPGRGGYKVEAWTLPGGAVTLEISRTAANSPDELARFSELVARLRARGVRPLDDSKTELGGKCP
ncbi:MAG TPA: hypothetical protein VGG65_04570 [Thermoanaerobaculia bacterium]